jgi:DNA-binding MarR family transcriptional regulator
MLKKTKTKAAIVASTISIPRRILVLSNSLGKGAVRLYAGKYGVQLAEWRLLSALADAEPASTGELAVSLGIDKAWVSRVGKALVDKGLAAPQDDIFDARRFRLVLTPAGKALHKKIQPASAERNAQLLSAFTAEEVEMLDYLLDKLQVEADRLADEALEAKA